MTAARQLRVHAADERHTPPSETNICPEFLTNLKED
jgi:hypothetical protein